MTIRLRPSDPETCTDLAFFLRRHDCPADVAGDGTVLVELPHLLHREQAQMELALYVRLWQVLHGVTVRADVVDSPDLPIRRLSRAAERRLSARTS